MPLDLQKKAGPLSRGAWVGVGAATLIAWYVYKRYQADAAANAANASTATTGGTTIPGSEAVTSTAGSTPVWSSYAQWQQAAISAMANSIPGYSATDAFNDLADWINGSCVSSQGYTAIGNVLNNTGVGLPPGFGTSLPPLTACATATTTTTANGSGSSGSTATTASGSVVPASAGQQVPAGTAGASEWGSGTGIFYIPWNVVFNPATGTDVTNPNAKQPGLITYSFSGPNGSGSVTQDKSLPFTPPAGATITSEILG